MSDWDDFIKREKELGRAPAEPAEYWIPPTAVFTGPNMSAFINQQNPYADPGKPFVQSGTTGGHIEGIGETIGPGRSTTPGQAQSQIASAQGAGIGDDWIRDFLARNPGDTNRLEEAYKSEWGGQAAGLSREQSEAIQSAGGSFTNTPGWSWTTGTGAQGANPWAKLFGNGQSWSGNWFDDPATAQLETLIKNQLNQLSNPGANDPQTKLMDFLMSRFDELSGSNGYSPQELALLNTQALEPIEGLRKSAQERELQRTSAAGYLPTSGLTRLNQQQNDLDYDRLRTQANRDLAVQNVNERSNRLNQALNLGQTALNTQRGTADKSLQLSTLLQQLPVQAMQQALAVLGGSTSPESLLSLVNQMTSVSNQQQYMNQQRNAQLWGAIGSLIPELFG